MLGSNMRRIALLVCTCAVFALLDAACDDDDEDDGEDDGDLTTTLRLATRLRAQWTAVLTMALYFGKQPLLPSHE